MTDLLTIEQAAEFCQCSTKTIKRAIDSAALRASQITRRGGWRIRRQDLDQWLSDRANRPAGRPVAAAATPGPRRRRGHAAGVIVHPGMGKAA